MKGKLKMIGWTGFRIALFAFAAMAPITFRGCIDLNSDFKFELLAPAEVEIGNHKFPEELVGSFLTPPEKVYAFELDPDWHDDIEDNKRHPKQSEDSQTNQTVRYVFHVGKASEEFPRSFGCFVCVTPSKDSPIQIEEYIFYLAENGEEYLALVPVMESGFLTSKDSWKPERVLGYLPFRVRTGEDELDIYSYFEWVEKLPTPKNIETEANDDYRFIRSNKSKDLISILKAESQNIFNEKLFTGKNINVVK
ncbi:MAG: hypothetical protein AAF939_09875 [Planctomycetota bacterium]